MALRFDNRVVLVTGSGKGLGRAYALLLGQLGASVVVNDISKDNAQAVVLEIKGNGGEAFAIHASVAEGRSVVQQTIDHYGKIDICICNAGIGDGARFINMQPEKFRRVFDTHLKGSFNVVHAAWPHMRKQKYGRILLIGSSLGLYGMGTQANYSAAKMAMLGFGQTLAKEGVKYNILTNILAPIALTDMTRDLVQNQGATASSEHVAPFAAYLCHETCPENGKLLETGAGYAGLGRWRRSRGVIFKTDNSFTPSAVHARWAEVCDMSRPTYPKVPSDIDRDAHIAQARSSPVNPQGSERVNFEGQTAIVTGAGVGLGRAYAIQLAALGARVVINDVNEEWAEETRQTIEKAGGQAITVICDTQNGRRIVDEALRAYGNLHVVIANAGNLRDKSFTAMSDREWDEVMNCHLYGTFGIIKAAWPHFVKQKYGRICTVSSTSGVYGNFGQSNYAAAKTANIGLSKTLASEGKSYNINVNIMVPVAGTNMTKTVWTQEMLDTFKTDYVAPVMAYLVSKQCRESGSVIEAAAGFVAKYEWQRSGGYAFPNSLIPRIEQVRDAWTDICKFDDRATISNSVWESSAQMYANEDNIFKSKL